MIVIVGLLLTAAAFGGLIWRLAPNQSLLEVSPEDVHFPTVSGFSLNRQELALPQDLVGELNILLVPFLQRQQLVVNTWIPFAQEMEAAAPGVAYYELPTINEKPSLSRMFINEGMRAGIPDEIARERTVTLYVDTSQFMAAAHSPGKDEVHILLVNRNGDILWRTIGRFDESKGEALLDAIEARLSRRLRHQ
jgi:hypothetical protein